jgi:methionine aminopeptidase
MSSSNHRTKRIPFAAQLSQIPKINLHVCHTAHPDTLDTETTYLDSRSINEVICHGIPDHRKLVEGDIINLGALLLVMVSF